MMGKIKKFLTSPRVTLGAFVLAAGLLLFSSIGGARAALAYYSDNYVSRVAMQNIGVTLLENGTAVASRDYGSEADGQWEDTGAGVLLGTMLADGETVKPGKTYPEDLRVQNTGDINQYVRVSIYKYWLDKDGNKLPELSPDLIELNLTNIGSDWLEDTAAKTEERTVLYYSKVLSDGATSAPFADTLTINKMIATKVRQETEGNIIKTVYAYDGAEFCVEARVDAVQDHNGEDAIWSAWGRRVSIGNGTLTLS